MSKGKKAVEIILWILLSIVVLLLVIVISAFCYFRFTIAKEYGVDGTQNQQMLNGGDFLDLAKDLSDMQLIDNVLHFDKKSAKEVMKILREINAENPNAMPEDENEEFVPQEGETAYERIMKAATKEEIEAGLAILKKLDIAKVNALIKEGKTDELKAYLKKVLTSEEVNTAVTLYRKYKHLL